MQPLTSFRKIIAILHDQSSLKVSQKKVIQVLDEERIASFDAVSDRKIVETIILKFSKTGIYPFDLGELNGESVKGEMSAKPGPISLNANYEDVKGFGEQWLRDIGYIVGNSILGLPDEVSREKIKTLQNTKAELLAALTLPDVDLESLKLATMLNMWLFVTDNYFDRKDCEVAKQPETVSGIFNAFIEAFNGRPGILPVGLSKGATRILLVLIKGIDDMGNRLRSLISDSELIKNVESGLELYAKGNISESRKKATNTNGDKKVIPLCEFYTIRDNAGAVDFVFELAFAVKGIKLGQQIRESSFKNITNLLKAKICYENDIFSLPKEENEDLTNGNLALLMRKSAPNFTRLDSINFVLIQMQNIVTSINDSKAIAYSEINDIFKIKSESDIILKSVNDAIKIEEDWDLGHVVWELATIRGRHPKNPTLDFSDITE